MVMAHVKIQFVSSLTPKWRCTTFGLFKGKFGGKFRGLKTLMRLNFGPIQFKGFKISKFNQRFLA